MAFEGNSEALFFMNPSIQEEINRYLTSENVSVRLATICMERGFDGYACGSLKSKKNTLDMVSLFFQRGNHFAPAAAIQREFQLESVYDDAVDSIMRRHEVRVIVASATGTIAKSVKAESDAGIRVSVKRRLKGILRTGLAAIDKSNPLDVVAGVDTVVAHVPGLKKADGINSLKTSYFGDGADAASIKPDAAFKRLLELTNISSEEYVAAVNENSGCCLTDGDSVGEQTARIWSDFHFEADDSRDQLISAEELVQAVDSAPNGFVPMIAFAVDAAYLIREWKKEPQSVSGGVLALHDFENGTGCPVRFEGALDLGDFPGGLIQAEGVPCDFNESYGLGEREFASEVARTSEFSTGIPYPGSV